MRCQRTHRSHRAAAGAKSIFWATSLLASTIVVCCIPNSGFPRSSVQPQMVYCASCIYDANPDHPWNELHRALFIREGADGNRYGADELDPLLWRNTSFLLTPPSRERALAALDHFLATHAENKVTDLEKRAMLQRDLWITFDWSAQRHDTYAVERRALQSRLAEALGRLSLDAGQIRSLPDNYAAALNSRAFAREYDPATPNRPFLPPDLFQKDGPWLCLTRGQGVTAPLHVMDFDGHSRFLVFMKVPGGRDTSRNYLTKLWEFPAPFIDNPAIRDRSVLNPAIPQFPSGTEFVLLRQLILFDRSGNLVVTPLTESVQIRVYRDVPARSSPRPWDDRNGSSSEQGVFEFKLSPLMLFSGKAGGLVPVAPEDKEFPIFGAHGIDLEGPVQTLATCSHCHFGPGLYSVRSANDLVKPRPLQPASNPKSDNNVAIDAETFETILWKNNRYDWGLLNSYLESFNKH